MWSLAGSKLEICCSICGGDLAISNAAVNVVQGSRFVEVRSVGITKGAAIDRILGKIVHSKSMINYVLCIGNFLGKDVDIYTFFEPEHLSEPLNAPGSSLQLRKTGGLLRKFANLGKL
ncbi:Alpha,alpha-trehalose-phosphate synthase [UDP-forming] 1 [Carex littledalei]|uniref:Alpha,alpha-trehalose-phosphate synthase [UDP-forming] 1 n=1 Tax=Carex littledalei TaxID=544730 RepID=A0A833REM8_9POAL|nr:Alpha,alpha-trehalose-phosphate synthase [UDP-forming] 1 [Carex littledalei]